MNAIAEHDWAVEWGPHPEPDPGLRREFRHVDTDLVSAGPVTTAFVGPVTAGAVVWPFPPLLPKIITKTTTTVTIQWTPVPACGYRFSVDAKVVSNTWNEAQYQIKFSRPQDGKQHIYELEPVLVGPGEKVQL